MPPRPKKQSEKTASKLLEAVKFLSLITKDEGSPLDTHILLSNKTATAFNGTLGAGILIDEDLYAAPHAKTFLNALMKCGSTYTLTQVDQNRLQIKSGPFKANIPCLDPALLFFPTPNPVNTPIDDNFKSALELVEKIKTENAQRLITLSFLLNGNSIISTDGKIIIEAWHGLNMPTSIPIPKSIIPFIQNQNKKLTNFGMDSTTATFYFEDNSFVRTQLYTEKWPDISKVLDRQFVPKELPKDLFKAIETIAPFSQNGFVYFRDGKLQSSEFEEKGAEFEIEGLINGPIYSAKYLMMLKDTMEKADFYVSGERKSLMCYFVGKNCRGVLMGFG